MGNPSSSSWQGRWNRVHRDGACQPVILGSLFHGPLGTFGPVAVTDARLPVPIPPEWNVRDGGDGADE
jgi:hypothetical protein